jgi:transcriptional regulator with XRE-family HTH domain
MNSNDKHRECLIAARLSALREMRGMTQEDVAKASGLKPAAVSHFETARRRPCIHNLLRLCEALRCTPNDLLL